MVSGTTSTLVTSFDSSPSNEAGIVSTSPSSVYPPAPSASSFPSNSIERSLSASASPSSTRSPSPSFGTMVSVDVT